MANFNTDINNLFNGIRTALEKTNNENPKIQKEEAEKDLFNELTLNLNKNDFDVDDLYGGMISLSSKKTDTASNLYSTPQLIKGKVIFVNGREYTLKSDEKVQIYKNSTVVITSSNNKISTCFDKQGNQISKITNYNSEGLPKIINGNQIEFENGTKITLKNGETAVINANKNVVLKSKDNNISTCFDKQGNQISKITNYNSEEFPKIINGNQIDFGNNTKITIKNGESAFIKENGDIVILSSDKQSAKLYNSKGILQDDQCPLIDRGMIKFQSIKGCKALAFGETAEIDENLNVIITSSNGNCIKTYNLKGLKIIEEQKKLTKVEGLWKSFEAKAPAFRTVTYFNYDGNQVISTKKDIYSKDIDEIELYEGYELLEYDKNKILTGYEFHAYSDVFGIIQYTEEQEVIKVHYYENGEIKDYYNEMYGYCYYYVEFDEWGYEKTSKSWEILLDYNYEKTGEKYNEKINNGNVYTDNTIIKDVDGNIVKTDNITKISSESDIIRTEEIKTYGENPSSQKYEVTRKYSNGEITKKMDFNGDGIFEIEDTMNLSYDGYRFQLLRDSLLDISTSVLSEKFDSNYDKLKEISFNAEKMIIELLEQGYDKREAIIKASEWAEAERIKLSITPFAEMKNEVGEVVEKEDGLYVNVGNGLVKLNISKQTYLNLFPATGIYNLEQQNIGDCYFISGCLIDMIKNPNSYAQILQMFSEDENGNISVNFPGSLGKYSPVVFENGELKTLDGKVDGKYVGRHTQVSGTKGIQMIEQAYAITRFAQNSSAEVSKIDIDAAINLIGNGGLQYNVYDEILGIETKWYLDISQSLFDLWIEYGSDITKDDLLQTNTEEFLKQMADDVNSGKILFSVGFYDENDAYDIVSSHAYSVEKIDTKNNLIYLMNPWHSGICTIVPFDEFIGLNKGFNIGYLTSKGSPV